MHLVQEQPLLRKIFKEQPIISYRKGRSSKHTRESKIVRKVRKPDILWSLVNTCNQYRENWTLLSYLGLSTPICTGALIKPVFKANKDFLMSIRVRVMCNLSQIMIQPIAILPSKQHPASRLSNLSYPTSCLNFKPHTISHQTYVGLSFLCGLNIPRI